MPLRWEGKGITKGGGGVNAHGSDDNDNEYDDDSNDNDYITDSILFLRLSRLPVALLGIICNIAKGLEASRNCSV